MILCGFFYVMYYQYGENQRVIKESKARSIHEYVFHQSFANHVLADSLINSVIAEEIIKIRSKLEGYRQLIQIQNRKLYILYGEGRWHGKCGSPHSWDNKIEHVIDTLMLEVNNGL